MLHENMKRRGRILKGKSARRTHCTLERYISPSKKRMCDNFCKYLISHYAMDLDRATYISDQIWEESKGVCVEKDGAGKSSTTVRSIYIEHRIREVLRILDLEPSLIKTGDVLSVGFGSVLSKTKYGKWKQMRQEQIEKMQMLRVHKEDMFLKAIRPSDIPYKSVLKCSRCKKSKIDTYSVQERGADEPMSVYCLCRTCNHTWKL
jgi:DNA-directed RNA polymerase subunit M/transcription elongation factor TFIIS